jgi:hypothetical protein
MSVEFPHILNDAISSEFVMSGSLERVVKYKKAVDDIATTIIVATAIALKLPSAVSSPSKQVMHL